MSGRIGSADLILISILTSILTSLPAPPPQAARAFSGLSVFSRR